jgi:allophanate hydrolase subunit 2
LRPAAQASPREGREIISDATVPGSIQVPGQGQPIVLLADGQTAGGYPKIATVISADLPRLAVMAPGQIVRFAAMSVVAAEQAARRACRRHCAR